MPVIHGNRNFVSAYEPLPEDRFVDTVLIGMDIDGQPKRNRLLTQPIEKYQEAVDWAVSMADVMAAPIEVVPMTAEEYERRCHLELLAKREGL